MTRVDLLSDTTYCEQAVKQLDQLLGNSNRFPVKPAQIYGLGQIARQQPINVEKFANHQRERTQRKPEIDFWKLVTDLCNNSSSSWSVEREGRTHLPEELQNPKSRKGKRHQREWLKQWTNEHIPAFFERFCTHALYRIGMAENS